MNEVSQRNVVIQGSDKDYDVLMSEETIRGFCAFLREVISHFEENKRLQEDAEAREMDLMHCIELTEDVTAEEKAQLYEKLTHTLQTRRACKIENQILKPLYDIIVDKQILNRLAQVQGSIGTVKATVAARSYACRTDVLDDFRVEPEDPPLTESPVPTATEEPIMTENSPPVEGETRVKVPTKSRQNAKHSK